MVADTGSWLSGRQVLVSPYALVSVNMEDENIGINLSKKQIEDSPSLDTDKPVSQQFELDYYGYYGWPNYWDGSEIWGAYPYLMRDSMKLKVSKQQEKSWNPHFT